MKIQCTGCKKLKYLTDFNKSSRAKNGLQSVCKLCQYKCIKKWRKKNVNKVRDYRRAYKIEYAKKNKDTLRKAGREYMQNVWRKSPRNRLNSNVLNLFRYALKMKREGRRWKKLLAYSVEELIEHLENQFDDKMTWDNYGKWHIDHIIPLSHFRYITEKNSEFKKCWALENLQPLWASENRKKYNFKPKTLKD